MTAITADLGGRAETSLCKTEVTAVLGSRVLGNRERRFRRRGLHSGEHLSVTRTKEVRACLPSYHQPRLHMRHTDPTGPQWLVSTSNELTSPEPPTSTSRVTACPRRQRHLPASPPSPAPDPVYNTVPRSPDHVRGTDVAPDDEAFTPRQPKQRPPQCLHDGVWRSAAVPQRQAQRRPVCRYRARVRMVC